MQQDTQFYIDYERGVKKFFAVFAAQFSFYLIYHESCDIYCMTKHTYLLQDMFSLCPDIVVKYISSANLDVVFFRYGCLLMTSETMAVNFLIINNETCHINVEFSLWMYSLMTIEAAFWISLFK